MSSTLLSKVELECKQTFTIFFCLSWNFPNFLIIGKLLSKLDVTLGNLPKIWFATFEFVYTQFFAIWKQSSWKVNIAIKSSFKLQKNDLFVKFYRLDLFVKFEKLDFTSNFKKMISSSNFKDWIFSSNLKNWILLQTSKTGFSR